VKKFESLEMKHKFFIDHKEIKLNQNIKNIKKELFSIKEQTKKVTQIS